MQNDESKNFTAKKKVPDHALWVIMLVLQYDECKGGKKSHVVRKGQRADAQGR